MLSATSLPGEISLAIPPERKDFAKQTEFPSATKTPQRKTSQAPSHVMPVFCSTFETNLASHISPLSLTPMFPTPTNCSHQRLGKIKFCSCFI